MLLYRHRHGVYEFTRGVVVGRGYVTMVNGATSYDMYVDGYNMHRKNGERTHASAHHQQMHRSARVELGISNDGETSFRCSSFDRAGTPW